MSQLHHGVILDSIADGVFTVDLDWVITSFNRAAEKITGVPREAAIGQKCCDVFHADICSNGCALRRSIENREELIDLRVQILDHEGRPIPISISTAVLRDEEGAVVGGVETFRDLSTVEILRKRICGHYTFHDIISKNHRIRDILNLLPDIAESDSSVLVEGPSGSGKELFARAIHNLSPRKKRNYVAVNCGALPDTLLESELFGYLKGAFTDARKNKEGRIALAEGGTLFLDEIGDISPAMQVKLLRVLQEREYEPLGSTRTVPADFRLVVATNKDLSDLVARRQFREDLYYRLNVVRISLPNLCQRREDIPLLVDHFIGKFNAEKDRRISRVSEDAMQILMRHDYPGNVRELENIVEYAFILCHGDRIEPEHLPVELSRSSKNQGREEISTPLESAEASAIRESLRRNGGNRVKTAHDLGVHKTTLWRKMKKYGIDFRH